jgi:DNA ligase-1
VKGNELTTRSGKIGGLGRGTRKRFTDAAAARKAAEKLIAEKTGKGYVEK